MTKLTLDSAVVCALQEDAQRRGCSLDTLLETWIAASFAEPPQNTELASAFFDLSLDLFCVLNEDGQILKANRAFAMLVGKNTAQLRQCTFIDVIHGNENDQAAQVIENLSHLKSPISFEYHYHAFDRTPKWFLWTIYPQIFGVFHTIGMDITPFKEMEAKEAERNVFAEALLDTVLAINNTSLALEQVLERMLSNIGKVVTCDYVSIIFVDGNAAEVVGIQNKDPYLIDVNLVGNERFTLQDNQYLAAMYKSRDCIIVPSIEDPPIWMVASALNVTGSFLGAPIVVEDVVIGFLGVFNKCEEFFTPLHAQQLTTFANQAGIAINNARLYEQAQSVAILRERQRVAQELHDSVNQDLFAASTYADLLPKALNKKPDILATYASDISRLIRGAVAQMRMILIELQPDTLTTTGLQELIQQLCNVFSKRTGILVDFHANKTVILNQDDQLVVYRIAQESLHNIDKHANATRVGITLIISGKHVELTIADNGSGFDQNAISEVQFGVRGMYERARSVQANLLIETQPGQGTIIKFRKNYER